MEIIHVLPTFPNGYTLTENGDYLTYHCAGSTWNSAWTMADRGYRLAGGPNGIQEAKLEDEKSKLCATPLSAFNKT